MKILAIGTQDVLKGAAAREPLKQLIERGEIEVEGVGTLHEAAARLGGAGGERVYALLVDAEGMTHREIQLLATLKRHKVLPLWLLQPRSSLRTKVLEALAMGAAPWEEAMQEMSEFPLRASTLGLNEGNNKFLISSSTADKIPVDGPDKSVEMLVDSGVVDRYDEATSTPLISAKEMQALLGNPE